MFRIQNNNSTNAIANKLKRSRQLTQTEPAEDYVALTIAINANDTAGAKKIVAEHPDYLHLQYSRFKNATPLGMALCKRPIHFEMLEVLLDSHADMNQPALFGLTPLEYAAKYFQLELCQFLINHKANPVAATGRYAGNLIAAVLDQDNLSPPEHKDTAPIIQMIHYLFPIVVTAGISIETLDDDQTNANHFQVQDNARQDGYDVVNVWPDKYQHLTAAYQKVLDQDKQLISSAYAYASFQQKIFASVKVERVADESDDYVIVADESDDYVLVDALRPDF